MLFFLFGDKIITKGLFRVNLTKGQIMTNRHSYKGNKRQKEHGLLVLLKDAIRQDCKRNNIEKGEFAQEIGLASVGSLENKLKKTKDDTDITLSEFIHILEITGDMKPLEYICQMFDQVMISTVPTEVTHESIHEKTDSLQIECSESFSTIKMALKDGVITDEEKSNMLSELEDTLRVASELKDDVKRLKTEEEE